MEELLAHMSQSTGKLRRVAQEWLGAVRSWLRNMGFASLPRYNASDLAHIIKQAREAAISMDVSGEAIMLRRNEGEPFID